MIAVVVLELVETVVKPVSSLARTSNTTVAPMNDSALRPIVLVLTSSGDKVTSTKAVLPAARSGGLLASRIPCTLLIAPNSSLILLDGIMV